MADGLVNLLGGQAPMTMIQPQELGLGEMLNQATPDLMANAAPMTMLDGSVNQAGELFNMGSEFAKNQAQDGGLMSKVGDFFGNAGMKDYASMLGGIGGLYQSLKAGELVDEQLQASKDSRALAQDERRRRDDFIKTVGSTFGNKPSNYYSA